MLIDSSCRIGEVAGLDNEHVGPNFILVKGKTGERKYRCNPAICEELKKIGEGKPAIFLNQYGKPANADNLQHRVARIIKQAGLTGKKLGAHTFRHSAAHLVAVETRSALAVKALLQHDDMETGKTYIGDAEDDIQQGISPLQLMNDRLGTNALGEDKQLTLAADTTPSSIDAPIVDNSNIIDLLELEYREIQEGTVIHSRLNSHDLNLIRRAFIGYTKTRTSDADNIELKNLFKRMLRLVKE
jgi:hypothetical protein